MHELFTYMLDLPSEMSGTKYERYFELALGELKGG